MQAKTQAQIIPEPRKAPRLRRGAAAVIAQYINDITRPLNDITLARGPLPCPPAA